jgi:hemolysin III
LIIWPEERIIQGIGGGRGLTFLFPNLILRRFVGLNKRLGLILWPPRDPVSALSHFIGFVLAIAGTCVLVIKGNHSGGALFAASFAVFGAAMMLLYFASAAYHWSNLSERTTLVLRKLDHAMIYILIAGTYTPICVITLTGLWGTSLLIAIWALALGGIFLTFFYFQAPRWLTTGIYIIMGWLVVLAFVPLSHSLPGAGLAWLLAGGIAYTAGGVIYGRKRSLINYPGFGFHEVFHLFVLGGSLCHYMLMLALAF